MFKATVLVDNIAPEGLESEWGFSVYIEYNGKNYLLDTGSTDLYLENAAKLGIDIEEADYTALSHAHYDHSGGYRSFFRKNRKAKLYVNETCKEDCYFKVGLVRKYIGIPKGVLAENKDRIVPASGLYQLDEGVWLVPHVENHLEVLGRKAHMYRKIKRNITPDNFSHEQSLVFDTEKGLVVLNSCSHGGLQNIMNDINHYLPGRKVYMTIGGLHLAGSSRKHVEEAAETIKQLSIDTVLTGHCTGEKPYEILREQLGDKVQQTIVGLVVEI